MGIVLIEKDLHHQIIMITMSLDEKLRKYMIEFMKITVFDQKSIVRRDAFYFYTYADKTCRVGR